jgi:hypothetical protein
LKLGKFGYEGLFTIKFINHTIVKKIQTLPIHNINKHKNIVEKLQMLSTIKILENFNIQLIKLSF